MATAGQDDGAEHPSTPPADGPVDPFATGVRRQSSSSSPASPIDNPPPHAPPSLSTAQHPTAPERSAKALGGLSTALNVLLSLSAIACAGAAALALSASSDARQLDAAGKESAFDRLEAGSGVADKLAVGWALFFVLALPIFVLLIIWTHRAHRNIQAFGATNPRLPSGMAIGSWFIPLFWYLGPYWCISDSYRGAAPDTSPPADLRSQPSSKLVLAWWLAFVIGYTVALASGGVPELSDVLADSTGAAMRSNLAGIGFAVLSCSAGLGAMAVRTVGRRQDERRVAMTAMG